VIEIELRHLRRIDGDLCIDKMLVTSIIGKGGLNGVHWNIVRLGETRGIASIRRQLCYQSPHLNA
jgi:hypothetical protein